MPRSRARNAKASRERDADELPAELDPKKLRFVGFGLGSLRVHAAKKQRNVALDADVARVFRTAEEVNDALRLVDKMRQLGKATKRRKSA